jgi:UTP:GlnB (protein PII) uridylyltransferase
MEHFVDAYYWIQHDVSKVLHILDKIDYKQFIQTTRIFKQIPITISFLFGQNYICLLILIGTTVT